jgi:aconitate hydratase
VVAKSFARIHWQNLVNFGILPLTLNDPEDWDRMKQGDELELAELRKAIGKGRTVKVLNKTQDQTYELKHDLTQRQVEMILEGSLINVIKNKQEGPA